MRNYDSHTKKCGEHKSFYVEAIRAMEKYRGYRERAGRNRRKWEVRRAITSSTIIMDFGCSTYYFCFSNHNCDTIKRFLPLSNLLFPGAPELTQFNICNFNGTHRKDIIWKPFHQYYQSFVTIWFLHAPMHPVFLQFCTNFLYLSILQWYQSINQQFFFFFLAA